MTAATPYPDPEILAAAADDGRQLTCHMCRQHPGNCPACLGSGTLRPCARCTILRSSNYGPCLICNGLGYTSGASGEREDGYYRCRRKETGMPWRRAHEH